jgi:hypothetical protein
MVGDFHALDKFGLLAFGDEKGQVGAATVAKDGAASPSIDDKAGAPKTDKTPPATPEGKKAEASPGAPNPAVATARPQGIRLLSPALRNNFALQRLQMKKLGKQANDNSSADNSADNGSSSN